MEDGDFDFGDWVSIDEWSEEKPATDIKKPISLSKETKKPSQPTTKKSTAAPVKATKPVAAKTTKAKTNVTVKNVKSVDKVKDSSKSIPKPVPKKPISPRLQKDTKKPAASNKPCPRKVIKKPVTSTKPLPKKEAQKPKKVVNVSAGFKTKKEENCPSSSTDLSKNKPNASAFKAVPKLKPKVGHCDSSSDVSKSNSGRKISFTPLPRKDLHEECSCNIDMNIANLKNMKVTFKNTNFNPNFSGPNVTIPIKDLVVVRRKNEGLKPIFGTGMENNSKCMVHNARSVTILNSPAETQILPSKRKPQNQKCRSSEASKRIKIADSDLRSVINHKPHPPPGSGYPQNAKKGNPIVIDIESLEDGEIPQWENKPKKYGGFKHRQTHGYNQAPPHSKNTPHLQSNKSTNQDEDDIYADLDFDFSLCPNAPILQDQDLRRTINPHEGPRNNNNLFPGKWFVGDQQPVTVVNNSRSRYSQGNFS